MTLLPTPRDVHLGDEFVAPSEPAVVADTTVASQGYSLEIATTGITLATADPAGEFYGRMTLRQLAREHDGRLPVGTIRDWPDSSSSVRSAI